MEKIKIKFKWTFKDYLLGYNADSYAHPRSQLLLIVLMLLVVASTLLGLSQGFSKLVDFGFLLAILIPAIIYILTPYYQFKRDPITDKEHTLIFAKDEIIYRTATSEMSIYWYRYRKFIEKKKFFVLYWDQEAFTTIPKRAFKTPEDMKRFKELLIIKQNIRKIMKPELKV